MAKIKFTPAQQSAIDADGGNILVSAAAGSGKTAVLTARVIRLLTKEDPVMADKLVIVTFTTAAASEMRQRIGAKLQELIELDPTNELLQTQQLLLGLAKICTIHSLCSGLIKEHFQLIGLTHDFKIGQKSQLLVLQNDAVNEVLEQHFEQKSEDFLSLFEFTCDKDDKPLSNMIVSIYDFIRSFPYPLEFLDYSLKAYDNCNNLTQTKWYKLIKSHCLFAFEKACELLNAAIELSQEDKVVYPKYSPALYSDFSQIEQAKLSLTADNWDKTVSILNSYEKVRLSSIRGFEDVSLLVKIKALRSDANDIVETIKKQYINITCDEFAQDNELLYPKISLLFCLVREVYEKIEEKKKDKNIIDYADLEHYALKLLVVHENSQNKQTEIAKELSQSYVEIMIDECQDINEVQNLIFKMLSRDETNIFMVGDIKQSIYRFRKAMPQIFIEKKETFKYYNKMTHNNLSKEKIILGNNFRSRPELTSTINLVFSQIMQKDMGEIEYDQDERLVASAIFDENKDAGAELHIIDYDKTLHEDKTECEARYIAKLINDMVDNHYMVSDGDTMRPCKYSDFAVLLRSKASKAQVYLEKFKEFNVPSWCDVSQGYFTSYEISVMLNLLRIIDNPLKDVALLCVLMSPMFGFSADKVTQIRLINKNQPLYLNLSQAANLGDEDAITFLKNLDELRTLSSVLPADRMIQKIYEQTDFISMVEAMFQEDQSSANLKLFLSYANQYEQSEHSGLYGFIRYIDRVIEKNDDFLSANTLAQNSNVVKIMSIHASKGLEFPICIVADCAKSFNKQDLNKNFQLNSNLGFSMKIREAEQLKEYTSLSFNAIKLATEKETIAEEMRVLYVAMTRAREKLIMVMTFTDAQTKISKINAQTNGISCPSPYDVYTSNSFADWLLLSFLTTPLEKDTPRYPVKLVNEQEQYLFSVKTIPVFGSQAVAPTLVDSSSISADSDEKLVEELVSGFNFSYHYEQLSQLPKKLTVTQIAKSSNARTITTQKVTPRFLSSSEMTPSQKGLALHAFMQYADFSNAKISVKDEINRLFENRFISKSQADSINVKKIEAFLQSGLFNRIMNASKVYKEYKFNYEIDAGEVFSGIADEFKNEKILIQGIADCIIVEENMITIIDYKTDYECSQQVLINRYQNQLQIYKQALQQELQMPVKECLLYSTHLETQISVNTNN